MIFLVAGLAILNLATFVAGMVVAFCIGRDAGRARAVRDIADWLIEGDQGGYIGPGYREHIGRELLEREGVV